MLSWSVMADDAFESGSLAESTSARVASRRWCLCSAMVVRTQRAIGDTRVSEAPIVHTHTHLEVPVIQPFRALTGASARSRTNPTCTMSISGRRVEVTWARLSFREVRRGTTSVHSSIRVTVVGRCTNLCISGGYEPEGRVG